MKYASFIYDNKHIENTADAGPSSKILAKIARNLTSPGEKRVRVAVRAVDWSWDYCLVREEDLEQVVVALLKADILGFAVGYLKPSDLEESYK